jgi:hypothetical protein
MTDAIKNYQGPMTILAWTNAPHAASFELMPTPQARREVASKADWQHERDFENADEACAVFAAGYPTCKECKLHYEPSAIADGICVNCTYWNTQKP